MENAHDLMHELVRRTDSGRRLLSVATLSAGGAIIAISIVGIAAAFAGRKTPEFVDVIAALSGAGGSAIFLFHKFPIFQDRESDIRRSPSKRKHKKPIDA